MQVGEAAVSKTDRDLQQAFDEAAQRGYTAGFAQGRIEAEKATQVTGTEAQREGYAAGHEAGLRAVAPLIDALRESSAQLEARRTALMAEAESFAADLALAIVDRLIATDRARKDFIRRAAQAAIKALAPATPAAIFLNPADAAHAPSLLTDLPTRLDENVPIGGVRVDAGRFVVEGDLRHAFELLEESVRTTKIRRRLEHP